MIDTALIDKLKVLVDKERKQRVFRHRFRIKGRITSINKTKNDNLTLTIRNGDDTYKITVLKSHKERYALVQKLHEGQSVAAEGIAKLRFIICTRLRLIEKGLPEGVQEKLLIMRSEEENT